MKKVLMMLSSHTQLGDTGRETGWYLPEAAHPWREFCEAGFSVDFVSPLGGVHRYDGFDENDPVQIAFLKEFGPDGPITQRADDVDASTYDAVFYVGGHGTMWYFADNTAMASRAATVFENGGVIGAVCHGPAGLVNVMLADGTLLVAGRRVSAFTDEEEEAVGLTSVVPYLLASKLKERGALHEGVANFSPHVVVDGRLVTGQNPASAEGVAKAVRELLGS